jgi:hypothetical protein
MALETTRRYMFASDLNGQYALLSGAGSEDAWIDTAIGDYSN